MNYLLVLSLYSGLLIRGAAAAEPPLAQLLDKARQGGVSAQLAVALRYRDAKGVERDHTEAMRWAHRAATPICGVLM